MSSYKDGYFLNYKVGKAYTNLDFDCYIRFNSKGEYIEGVCVIAESGKPFATLGDEFLRVFIRLKDLKTINKRFEAILDEGGLNEE